MCLSKTLNPLQPYIRTLRDRCGRWDARQQLAGAEYEVTEWISISMERFASRRGHLRGERMFLCGKP
jgi:hypothetical protein